MNTKELLAQKEGVHPFTFKLYYLEMGYNIQLQSNIQNGSHSQLIWPAIQLCIYNYMKLSEHLY